MDNKFKRLFGDTFLFAIGSFGSKFLVFFMLPLYTSVLTKNEYGTVDIVINAVNLLVPILTLSICDATLRFALSKNSDPRKVLSNSMLMLVIATIVLLVATPLVKFFWNTLYQNWWYLLAIFISTALHQCLANYIKGINKTKLFAVQGFLSTVVLVLCNLLFLLVFKWGIQGYLLAIIISNFLSIVFVCFAARLWHDIFVPVIEKELLREMLLYSTPMLLTTIAWWANTSLDKYMLVAFAGLAANGLYAVAHKIPTIFTTFTTLFSQAWRISAISDYEDSDIKSTAKFYSMVHGKYALLCIYACAGITLFSRLIAKILFQAEFFSAWVLVPPLMLASLLEAYSGFLASIYAALKKTKLLTISTLFGMIVNIGLNYFLIRQLGIIGAPIATFLSFSVVWIIRLIIVRKFVPIEIDFIRLIPSIVLLSLANLYFAFDLPYKVGVYLLNVVIIVLINIRETIQLLKFPFETIKKLCKRSLKTKR